MVNTQLELELNNLDLEVQKLVTKLEQSFDSVKSLALKNNLSINAVKDLIQVFRKSNVS